MSREETLGTFQMLWDCSACGTTKLLGLDHRHCPNCGSAQDPERRYFPAEGEGVLVEDHVYVGADRRCPACETPCAAAAHNCGNCGSPLDEAQEVLRREAQGESPGGFESDDAKRARQEFRAQKSPAPPPPARSRRGPVLAVVAIVSVLVLVLGAMLAKRSVEVEVVGHRWERTIAVERFDAVPGAEWRELVPKDAYQVRCERAVRSQRSVPDGETCSNQRRDRGDGTFEVVRECRPKTRMEPVYDQKCSFQVDRWRVHRTERTTGGLSDPLSWPEPKLAREGDCRGCERLGERREQTLLALVDRDEKLRAECAVPLERWKTVRLGAKVAGSAGLVTGKLDCGSLRF